MQPHGRVWTVIAYATLQFRIRERAHAAGQGSAKLPFRNPRLNILPAEVERENRSIVISLVTPSRYRFLLATRSARSATSFIRSNVSFPIRRRDSGYKFPRSNMRFFRVCGIGLISEGSFFFLRDEPSRDELSH